MQSDRQTQKEKRKLWVKRSLLTAVIALAIVVGTFSGYYGYQIVQLLADVSEDTPEELRDTSESDESIRAMHPISILALGLDEDDVSSRSDSMMVITLNPGQESTKIVSIPRDTLITLPNSDRQEKMNALHAIYGISGVIDYIEDYLAIPLSFYVTLNFDGLVDLVDAVGGITVDSPLSFTVQDSEETLNAIEIEEGMQKLDGEQALGYARMRKQDPRGDFGRQERQRQVIEALADKLLSFGSIANLTPILNAIRPNMQTNMTGQQIMSVASNYRPAAQSVESIEIAGTEDFVYFPEYGHELYVYRPYEQSLLAVQEELQAHLELEDVLETGIDEDLPLENDNSSDDTTDESRNDTITD
ncbi:LytR family transcriptional regulator [Alkalibacterium sp. s-m-22]|uniref:LytR family transcriptional regulator n=1 Tax=Alkalibacterium indicireducens TaxID=398758 RepID=A0ABP3L4Y2_9LACT